MLILAVLALGLFWLRRHHAGERGPLPVPQECKLGPTTAGIDVSYHQGDISWPRVRRAGVRFAFIRISDGGTVFDEKFGANWSGAQRAKIRRGGYQYFRPNESAIDQADLVVRTLRLYGMGELPPVIDIEETGGLPLATVATNAKAWIDRVRTELKVEPIVYTNPGMWKFRDATELGTQPLWLAHYTQTCPVIPSPWVRWRYWQYTDNGRVDGVDGPVDLDVFDGTIDDLRR